MPFPAKRPRGAPTVMTNEEVVAWLRRLVHEGSHLRVDSRLVEPGDVFVALPGRTSDGRHFIRVAEARGAAGAIYEARENEAAPEHHPMPTLPVPKLSERAGEIAALFYGKPAESMLGVAVTGTNGKTTTSHWCAQLLSALGRPCAAVGTIGTFLAGERFPSPGLTTPDAVSLEGLLFDLKAHGAQAFAVEASSIGLVQGRLSGAAVRIGVFTNLTRDHLDYHGSMEAYEEAKRLLFARPELEDAVLNADDPAAEAMAETARAHGVRVWATSLRGEPAWAHDRYVGAEDVRAVPHGMRFTLVTDEGRFDVEIPLAGDFNVANLLGVVAVLRAAGYAAADFLPHLSSLRAPEGRMQMLRAEGVPLAVVDYAHTPDALVKALANLRPIAKVRGGRLWVVFGCGGDRDAGKRPLMAAAAEAEADRVVVTSDNPRTESPEAILSGITAGFRGAPALVEADRRKAIHEAILAAAPEDVVLVAGKGHEDYQEINGVRHPFSDAEVVREVFVERRTRLLSGDRR